MEKRLELSPGSHLLTDHLGCWPSIIFPLDTALIYHSLGSLFLASTHIQLDFSYLKRIHLLSLFSFISPYQMSLKREVYTHCLHLPPVDSFVIKLSFSYSPLSSKVISDLVVAEFDGYFFGSFLSQEYLTVSNIILKNYYGELPTCTNVERIHEMEDRKRWSAIYLIGTPKRKQRKQLTKNMKEIYQIISLN